MTGKDAKVQTNKLLDYLVVYSHLSFLLQFSVNAIIDIQCINIELDDPIIFNVISNSVRTLTITSGNKATTMDVIMTKQLTI